MPASFSYSRTTHQTAFSLRRLPQTWPVLLTQRKTTPVSIHATASHESMATLTQSGTGTVRTCPSMNPDDKDPLDEFLGQWKVPDTPAQLKDAVSKGYRRRFAQRGWRWFLRGSLRIPVPFALAGVAAAVLLACATERYEHAVESHAQALVESQSRRAGEIQKVEVPVYRDRVVVRIPCPCASTSRTHSVYPATLRG